MQPKGTFFNDSENKKQNLGPKQIKVSRFFSASLPFFKKDQKKPAVAKVENP